MNWEARPAHINGHKMLAMGKEWCESRPQHARFTPRISVISLTIACEHSISVENRHLRNLHPNDRYLMVFR